ncbi:MAG: NAD(P)/FAD-dependent oxidoreductase [marine benthic group bacterium]|nr:NAD(P)/FAD-dependent oxidoreductase [Gemmatimonadota bacterium]
MKKLLILGAGTAGTMMAAKMRRNLDRDDWEITVVDQDDRHIYQPGLLFIPFSIYRTRDVIKPRSRYIPRGVDFITSEIDVIEPDRNRVRLSGGVELEYDFLVIATGSRIVPEETEGLTEEGWQETAFDFYTLDGAARLEGALEAWEGGRLVLNVVEMPIKCPIAPIEFVCLADWYLTEKGVRDKTEILYATPLEGAFTKPRASAMLGDILDKKNIKVEGLYSAGSVDGANGVLKSWDEREISYDLLVTIPTHMGSETIERSDMGDELSFVPTNKNTLQADGFENIFVLGDATDLPSSKAGSVAHFQGEVLEENLLRAIMGRPLVNEFDGHANCFIETGFGKAVLIDFNYDVEPLPGKYPVPGVGPLSLLGESEMNHWGKMAFRWIYWNMLLKGAEIPGVESRMSMAGKWS